MSLGMIASLAGCSGGSDASTQEPAEKTKNYTYHKVSLDVPESWTDKQTDSQYFLYPGSESDEQVLMMQYVELDISSLDADTIKMILQAGAENLEQSEDTKNVKIEETEINGDASLKVSFEEDRDNITYAGTAYIFPVNREGIMILVYVFKSDDAESLKAQYEKVIQTIRIQE